MKSTNTICHSIYNMKLFIRIVIIISLALFLSSYRDEGNKPLPFKKTSSLETFKNLTAITPNNNTKCVVIYTTQSCKPCLKLAKQLNEKFRNDSSILKSIIYFNPSVLDQFSLEQYIVARENYKSPYFYKEQPNKLTGIDYYPYISFHNSDGLLIDSIIGYNQHSLNKIIKHLSRNE